MNNISPFKKPEKLSQCEKELFDRVKKNIDGDKKDEIVHRFKQFKTIFKCTESTVRYVLELEKNILDNIVLCVKSLEYEYKVKSIPNHQFLLDFSYDRNRLRNLINKQKSIYTKITGKEFPEIEIPVLNLNLKGNL